MGVLRATATAVLILATALSASAQCVSDVRTISTRQSVPNLVAGPAAWGSGVLAVAKTDPANGNLFVATYDHELNQLSGDTLMSSDVADNAPALVANGSGFGLFYRTDDSRRLVLQRLTLGGQPLGTPIPVSTRNIDFDEEIDATWSDALDAYVVATTFELRSQIQVWVTVIDRDGIVQRDVNTFVFAAQGEAALNVAVAEDGVIGVFYRSAGDESIAGVRIPRNANPIADTIWTTGRDLNVTALGNRFHLVKSVEFTAGHREIRWMAIDSAGRVVVTDRVLLRVNDLDLRPMALVHNGQELALSYLEGAPFGFSLPSFRLHRFASSGATIANSLFAAANPAQRFASSPHDFVWTGSAYVSTAVFENGRQLDSILIRLCPLRAFVAADRLYVTNDEFVNFTGSAEGGVPGYTYTWSPGNVSNTFSGPALRYRYIHNGVYTATLTVTDESGVSTSTTATVHVVERKKRAVRK